MMVYERLRAHSNSGYGSGPFQTIQRLLAMRVSIAQLKKGSQFKLDLGFCKLGTSILALDPISPNINFQTILCLLCTLMMQVIIAI